MKNDCWTCSCLQRYVMQLVIDLKNEAVTELNN